MKNRNETRTGSRRKLLICFFLGVVLLTAAVVLLATDPIPIVAKKYSQISPDSFALEFLKKKIDGLHISFYIFNITNAEEFMSGEDLKLKLEEVGPFTYRETVILQNLELDEGAGVMRYSSRFESDFVPEESIGYPEDFNLTMPNVALLGLTSIMSSYPYFVRVAFNFLVQQQKSKPIITLDARRFLWGYSDPLLKLANTIVPGVVNFDKIGILDQFYNIKKNDLVVGATERDKFMIKTRNGHKKLMMSPLQDTDMCTKCDTFENTYEGMMYPAPIRSDTPIRLFRSGFCKIVDFVFHEKRVLENGVEGLVFQINNTYFEHGRTRGFVDYSDCLYGLPVSISKVRFLDVDPKLYERLDGIQPDPNNYNSYIMIEPITGVEIDTYVAVQINLQLGDVTFNSESRRLSGMVLPACYSVVKQPKLVEVISSVLKVLYVTLPLILLIARIVLFILAFTLLAYSVRLLYSRAPPTKHVTSLPILTEKNDENSNLRYR